MCTFKSEYLKMTLCGLAFYCTNPFNCQPWVGWLDVYLKMITFCIDFKEKVNLIDGILGALLRKFVQINFLNITCSYKREIILGTVALWAKILKGQIQWNSLTNKVKCLDKSSTITKHNLNTFEFHSGANTSPNAPYSMYRRVQDAFSVADPGGEQHARAPSKFWSTLVV